MAASAKREQCRIGFLTVVELPELGFVGGLLITNELGRPLEFQCTTPVRANRTQEILYGPTLQEFLCADLIGKTLLERATIRPDLVLAEQSDFLGLRAFLDVPLAVLHWERDEATIQDSQDSGAAAGGTVGVTDAGAAVDTAVSTAVGEAPSAIRVGRNLLTITDEYAEDRQRIGKCGRAIPNEADLSEPFERIREALRETLRAAG